MMILVIRKCVNVKMKAVFSESPLKTRWLFKKTIIHQKIIMNCFDYSIVIFGFRHCVCNCWFLCLIAGQIFWFQVSLAGLKK